MRKNPKKLSAREIDQRMRSIRIERRPIAAKVSGVDAAQDQQRAPLERVGRVLQSPLANDVSRLLAGSPARFPKILYDGGLQS